MAKKQRVDKVLPAEPAGPQDNAQIVRANLNRAVEVSASFASLYANDVQVQVTPWDIRLICGQIASVPTPEDPSILVRQVGEVRMSPQLAKKLTLILLEQLQGYEKRIGPIAIPKD